MSTVDEKTCYIVHTGDVQIHFQSVPITFWCIFGNIPYLHICWLHLQTGSSSNCMDCDCEHDSVCMPAHINAVSDDSATKKRYNYFKTNERFAEVWWTEGHRCGMCWGHDQYPVSATHMECQLCVFLPLRQWELLVIIHANLNWQYCTTENDFHPS